MERDACGQNEERGVDVSERLTRVEQLLASLPGAYGNGQMRTLIVCAGWDSLAVHVLAFIAKSANSPSADGKHLNLVPRDAAELESALTEADESGAHAVFERLTSRTLAYRTPGRYPGAKATTVFRTLAQLLGPGARWLSNTDLAGWHPVTHNTMDALLLGTGGGVLVAVLVTDED